MNKTLKFQCWKCLRIYKFSYEITDKQKFSVTCPYCKTEGVVDLEPHGKVLGVIRRIDDSETSFGDEQQLPGALPTQAPQ